MNRTQPLDNLNNIKENDQVVGVFYETAITGVVTSIDFGGRVTYYSVNLDKPVEIFGKVRTTIMVGYHSQDWRTYAEAGENFLVRKDHAETPAVAKMLSFMSAFQQER